MNRDETSRLLRARSALTSQPYGDEAITAWLDALQAWTFDQCRAALVHAAKDRPLVTVAHVIEWLPNRDLNYSSKPAPEVCIRCRNAPAAGHGRSRCDPCQLDHDAETARGQRSAALTDALAAAHRTRTRYPGEQHHDND